MGFMTDPITVEHDEAHHRYNAIINGAVAGSAHYRVRDTKDFWHTEVKPEFEGQGVGSALARAVFEDLRSRGEKAKVECPFLTAYLKRHPEYADLVLGS
jgi:predicted GNAT family acetyltransferase